MLCPLSFERCTNPSENQNAEEPAGCEKKDLDANCRNHDTNDS
jgi:hypothetical protein